MINWREGKAAFVGASKYFLKGVFSFSRSVTTAAPTEDCFEAFEGPINPDAGFVGLINPVAAFVGLINDDAVAVVGLINDDPVAVLGTIFPDIGFEGEITDSEGFEGEICDC